MSMVLSPDVCGNYIRVFGYTPTIPYQGQSKVFLRLLHTESSALVCVEMCHFDVSSLLSLACINYRTHP